ncbi:unnamed protein product [Acanthoscelides obtectus]|uniref:Uncharacterized protein n=1 Tax=Acanthoscelides obtectus TaxID=200917 RepID=A0A9P0L8Q9_ACAOB|nr:unnamed protein product [Acanthoscelides obtectus]CAK1637552.1 hypothetical protein AOBTE_LOCUS10043 [Acanthoscelides obtectus]
MENKEEWLRFWSFLGYKMDSKIDTDPNVHPVLMDGPGRS